MVRRYVIPHLAGWLGAIRTYGTPEAGPDGDGKVPRDTISWEALNKKDYRFC